MKNIGIYIYTWLNGSFVGKDEKGNKYYTSSLSHGTRKEKRWVLYYNKIDDPTSVNPDWHAWLHHIDDNIPNSSKKKKFKWQKKLSPNLTGTKNSYRPSGFLLNKKKPFIKKKYYESWDPNKK